MPRTASEARVPATPSVPDSDSWSYRLTLARHAVRSAGAALLALRGSAVAARETDGQLKTAVDAAAEGWVLGFLRTNVPGDAFLCEESFDAAGAEWTAPNAYWTVDALDGTRSYVEGFDGFCVQVGYVVDGRPRLGAVYEPVADRCYYGAEGLGAFEDSGGVERRLELPSNPHWPQEPRFVDSTRPGGAVGAAMAECGGQFVECGSIGLKICRVASGEADVFAKELTFKLWDVAPAELILEQAGGRLSLWNGEPVPYDGVQVRFRNLLATTQALHPAVVIALHGGARANL